MNAFGPIPQGIVKPPNHVKVSFSGRFPPPLRLALVVAGSPAIPLSPYLTLVLLAPPLVRRLAAPGLRGPASRRGPHTDQLAACPGTGTGMATVWAPRRSVVRICFLLMKALRLFDGMVAVTGGLVMVMVMVMVMVKLGSGNQLLGRAIL